MAQPVLLDDLPTVITGPGDYVTRDGRKATIYNVGGVGATATFAARGSIWRMFRGQMKPRYYTIWHVSGRNEPVIQTARDIVGPWVEPQ